MFYSMSKIIGANLLSATISLVVIKDGCTIKLSAIGENDSDDFSESHHLVPMNKSRTTLIPSGILGDMGVALTRFRFGQIGLIFREKPTQDHGIDGEIELLVDGSATGRLISAQIKCGPSYLDEVDENGYVFRFQSKHYEYWINHSLPVIGVLVDHEAEICFWGLISAESIEKTGKGYKTSIPKSQIVSLDFLENLTDLAAPAIANSSFQIVSEEDKSTGLARRISLFVRVNAGPNSWTRPRIRQLMLQMTSDARSSDYYRNEITANQHRNKKADVVWVYVYRSENDRNLGAYIAKSIWIAPSLEPENRPMTSDGEIDASGMIIDWNDRFDEIINAVDKRRSSKADFVHHTKSVLETITPFIVRHHKLKPTEGEHLKFSEFITQYGELTEKWTEELFPPHECERLGNRMDELLTLLESAIIFAERLTQTSSNQDLSQFQNYINDALSKLEQTKYELEQIT